MLTRACMHSRCVQHDKRAYVVVSTSVLSNDATVRVATPRATLQARSRPAVRLPLATCRRLPESSGRTHALNKPLCSALLSLLCIRTFARRSYRLADARV